MTGKKIEMGLLLFISILFISACKKQEQEELRLDTPARAAEYVMENLKALDLEAFNGATDNDIGKRRNGIGIPKGNEYQVFQELLEPRPGKKRKYEADRRFAEKLMEHLSWKVKDIREDGEQAEIDMEITNLDMAKAMGNYEISILEHMAESEGTGLGQLMQEVADLLGDQENLMAAMDSLEEGDFSTIEVTVQAYWEGETWKLHLNDAFINAFMGNMNAESYSEEVENRLEELEEQLEKKMEGKAKVMSLKRTCAMCKTGV